MKKKVIVLLLASVMTLSALSGCDKSKREENYIVLGDYKGIEIERESVEAEITEQNITLFIEDMLYRNAVWEEITNGVVESGDTVNVSYTEKLDGKILGDGEVKDYTITIGMGQFMEGFDESLIGHNIGDTYSFEGKFPSDYYDKEVAGRDIELSITVNAISRLKIPELNDEFVQMVSQSSTTVEEYREEVKNSLEENKTDDDNLDMIKNVVWQQVLDNAQVEKYPEGEVEGYEEKLIELYKKEASSYGLDYEKYVRSKINSNLEEFELQLEETAKEAIKQKLVVKEIAKKEKIVPNEKQYNEEFEKLAPEYGYESAETMKKDIEKEELELIVLQKKVIEWLAENAKIHS